MTWQLGFRDAASGQVIIAEMRPSDPFLVEGLGLKTFEAQQAFGQTEIPLRSPLFRVRIDAPNRGAFGSNDVEATMRVWGGRLVRWDRLPTGA